MGCVSARAASAPTPAPASSGARAPRGGGSVPNFSAPAAARSRSHVVARAHPNSPRSRRTPRPDDLVTPQGRYPSAWATDLADIFGWDDVLEASGVGAGDGDEATAATRVLLPKRIALDGANIAWCYSAALHAAFGSRNKQPLSRGVVAALEHEAWARIDADVVAFVPSTYVEGPLHGLADGGSLGVVVPRHVRYLGRGTWRNERLFAEVRRGRVRLVERAGERSADDLTIIDYGRAREARIVSNDRYGDHKMGHGELKKYLKNHLFDYEFVFGTDAKRIREEVGDVASVEVGSAFLPPPPVDEGSETWDQSVHAEGSSRPWARYAKDALWGKQARVKKRRSMGKVVRVQHASSDDLGFPFWAVDDAHIPVEFNPSCKF